MDNLKQRYFDLFREQFRIWKLIDPDKSKEELFEQTIQVVEKSTIKPHENWRVELHKELVDTFHMPKYTILRAGDQTNWYTGERKFNRFFWNRYQTYLEEVKEWDGFAVEAINSTTDDIMSAIGDPKSSLQFDRRGLVLGYVQSGKTANFTGLINKAYDAGYKLIIVLSGMHNDLRAQTQLRLETEVVGFDSRNQEGSGNAGVAQIRPNDSDHLIDTLTSITNDISSKNVAPTYNLDNRMTLIVAKKNKSVLESLVKRLKRYLELIDAKVPLLIIDDEADQASIDTSKKGEASTINRLIRQVLELFEQKSYVGYTATPFANLLIDSNKKTVKEGLDLYPKDFMIGLPQAYGYCGPEEFFNSNNEADNNLPSLIIPLKKLDIDMFTVIKKPKHANKFNKVPPQMLEAIKSFIIVTSIREKREQKKNHNSMLIHTSRFKDVQSNIKEEVEAVFSELINEIKYNSNGEIVRSIKKLYNQEFLEKTRRWNQVKNEKNEMYNWEDIYSQMRLTIEKISVMEINGNSKDALEYDRYKTEGLYVIAVGGEKLSRGLTLEGLTISYYYRNTLMYDTLMQMGRWFGFRKGYLDLCRIYTSPAIASNFEHLAIAMVELRMEFDKLKGSSKTPIEYATKMLSHPSMTLTSPLKMKNATLAYTIYKKTLQQTRLFAMNESFYKDNMEATINLVNKINGNIYIQENSNGNSKYKYHVADNVSINEILDFLNEYNTRSENKMNSRRLTDYIKIVNDEFNELSSWKVAIVEGVPTKEETPIHIGDLKLKYTVSRGMGEEGNYIDDKNGQLDIGAIVAAEQEFFYLKREDTEKEETRSRMSKNEGLLMIYPLNPRTTAFKGIDKNFTNKFDESFVPIGIALSFPDSEIDDSKVYLVNKTVKKNEKSRK